jgi:hypothetical protein
MDLYITNYYADANTFYRQIKCGLFQDATRDVRLSEASFHKLGYGTQFLDADLDGALDLVVANGHEGNYTDLGIPFEMEPQFFRHDGSGRFADRSADVAGGYFEGKYVARALARLDWNRDGREDFMVSHLDCPLALVTNETTPSGAFLSVRLHGSDSSRDAIGTRVTVSSGETRYTRQLVAGDGYMASNQRVLIFGLGPRSSVDQLTVRWPSGRKQQFGPLPVNCEVILVEGQEVQVLSCMLAETTPSQ